MQRVEKETEVDGLRERFGRMISAVFVNYQGLDVASVTRLREQLQAAGVEYKVVKNTLIRRAVEDQDWAGELGETLTGMTAVAWSYEEPGAAAKVFKEFSRKNEHLKVKAGVVEGSVLDSAAVLSQLATMPGRDELRAMLLATFMAPATQFVRTLQAPATNFLYLLKAREDQQEGSS